MKCPTWLGQIFCRHDWQKIAFFQEIDETHNLRYSIRRYRCRKCGRVSHQDSRCDRLERNSAR